MELRHLRYFVAVAEELSFSRAAERLHKAQPPLSRQIQNLEQSIGAALFVRGGKRLELTSAGQAFLREARLTLQQSERAILCARLAAAGTTGTIQVGYMALGLYADSVQGIFRKFEAQYPTIQTSFTLMPPAAQLDALQAKQIDLGIIHADSAPKEHFCSERISDEALEFMFPMGHPLATKRELRLRDLADEPFVMFPRAISPVFYDRLFKAWEEAGFRPRIVRESDSFPTTVVVVANGGGISFAGRNSGAQLSANVVIRRAVDFGYQIGTDLVWRKRDNSATLSLFVGYFEQARSRPQRGVERAENPASPDQEATGLQ
jgi:DNA-binding transcriptional LysR family regulator